MSKVGNLTPRRETGIKGRHLALGKYVPLSPELKEYNNWDMKERYDFRLKHFGIYQGGTAMKVGTDAIALGAWVANLGLAPQRILDVGAGTGILSLMMAQAYPESKVDALELDEGAARDAELNFSNSPWSQRLRLYRLDALSYTTDMPYDLIISNPPFFSSDGPRASGQSRSLARNEVDEGLGVESLVKLAGALLTRDGALCLIAPSEREEDLRRAAAETLMYVDKLCDLEGAVGSVVRQIYLLRSARGAGGYHKTETSQLLLRDSSGQYSSQYKILTSEYLLPLSID